MNVDLSKLAFYSGANYMKRSEEFTGSTAMTLPGSGLAVTHTVTHNLGYIPYFDVFADLDNDGIIWAGEKIDQNTDSSAFGATLGTPALDYWCTATTLTIRLLNNTSPLATGTRTVYWVIYLDYGSTT